jgi:predicted ester cyclase
MAVADVIFAPDVRFHYPAGDLNDVDAVKSYIAAVRTAFPDLRFTIEDPFGEGERVAVRWSLVGTQTGEFRSKPPTGKQVKHPGNTNEFSSFRRVRSEKCGSPSTLLSSCSSTGRSRR